MADFTTRNSLYTKDARHHLSEMGREYLGINVRFTATSVTVSGKNGSETSACNEKWCMPMVKAMAERVA